MLMRLEWTSALTLNMHQTLKNGLMLHMEVLTVSKTPQEALESIKLLHRPVEQSFYEKQRSGHQSTICGGCGSLYTIWPCETRKIADSAKEHVYSNWRGW